MDYNSEYSAAGAGIGAGMVIFWLAVMVLVYASLWKVFVKAGKPGWAAIIPIYNLIVMIEIVGKPTIWVLWMLIPCVNIVFGIWLTNLLSKSFGKTEGYTVGLLLLPIVFYPMLGFGDAKYLGPSAAEAQNGFNNFGGNNPFGSTDPFNQPPKTPNA
ncbi:hypothetical protein FBD94_15655 [Pedobacter hiemivivus]|uniref:Signal peptidase I n=1 Tax=Pedobacter hiemivivus TaxID=2530454 RepID=A0A4U1GBP8_9SPHI|nr:DUF5684 domain-containing protein [Pedobacter hiemivivus]TCC97641.1 hypothetical protein EZ444_06925 [Pedobacter hiemivivus]TKC60340.1 hypothetical protein FBD94_15655 [Pedobacter hiemivivus]